MPHPIVEKSRGRLRGAPVRRAVDALGGIFETQIAIRVNYSTLRKWLKTGVVPTTRYAVALSEATGGRVSVKELAGHGTAGR
jgi:hypothetical protein